MIKIVFFAPYPDILPVIEQVFRERPESEAIRYEVVQDFYNNRLEQVEADVVIARGFTAHTLKRKNIPCAELKSTGYDVMKAVNECMQKGNIERIAVVGAFNMVYGAEQMCHLYPNLGLGCYAEDDETKLEMAVHQAMKDGNQAIVGGYSTVQIAERLGMPAAMIHSGIEAVNHAISEAIAVAHLTRYERQKRDEIANIMNYSFQGIISVNRKGIITLANTCCHTYMRDRKTSLAGEHIKDFFPDIDFDSVIRDKQKILSEVCRFGGKQVLVNCVPVAGDSEEFGCVLTFQGTEQIQAEEGKLRKRMHSDGFTARYDFSHILYRDSCMEAVISQAVKFSYSDSNILIHGETGTGKELFAQSIHNSSRRRKGPFVAINCAALPENLLESELFGYERGAFAGALKTKKGLIELADGGTVFLDEIGELPMAMQTKLLTFLDDRKFKRIGALEDTAVDVRIIAATNRNLEEAIKAGQFREDLFYRLNVMQIEIPPLRDRREDIPVLCDYYLDYYNKAFARNIEKVDPDFMRELLLYDWKGNVRELKNIFERCFLFSQGNILEKHVELAPVEREARPESGDCIYLKDLKKGPLDLEQEVAALEKRYMSEALKLSGNNLTRAAALLGVTRFSMKRKMEREDGEK